MSAPTLAQICLPPNITITYDDARLDPFYVELLFALHRNPLEACFSIGLKLEDQDAKDRDTIWVTLNGNIFARLSRKLYVADACCLIEALKAKYSPSKGDSI